MFVMSVIVLFTLCSLIKNRFIDNIDDLLNLALIIALAAAISSLTTHFFIKPFFGRERFRAIHYFDCTSHAIADQGFTRWYVLNGNASDIAASFNDSFVTKDFFKSFTSGHTTSCSMVYVIMLLPLLYDYFKSKKGKILCVAIPITIMALVATSRIVMGAHYLSDVLVGGTIGFLSVVLGFYLNKWCVYNLFSKIFK